MHPTDPADAARRPPAAPTPDAPPGLALLAPSSSARHEAAATLERLAADLDSIADRWAASRTSTAAELRQVRDALAAAQAALAVLAGAR